MVAYVGLSTQDCFDVYSLDQFEDFPLRFYKEEGKRCSSVSQIWVDIHFQNVDSGSDWNGTKPIEERVEYPSGVSSLCCDIFDMFTKTQCSTNGNTKIFHVGGSLYSGAVYSQLRYIVSSFVTEHDGNGFREILYNNAISLPTLKFIERAIEKFHT